METDLPPGRRFIFLCGLCFTSRRAQMLETGEILSINCPLMTVNVSLFLLDGSLHLNTKIKIIDEEILARWRD